jgi:hypothetical protein
MLEWIILGLGLFWWSTHAIIGAVCMLADIDVLSTPRQLYNELDVDKPKWIRVIAVVVFITFAPLYALGSLLIYSINMLREGMSNDED